jgi:predicted DNA-binding transcriptional regulator AlpA
MAEIDTSHPRIKLAAQLALMADDTLIGPDEVASLLASTWQSVQKLARRDPERLPPRAAVSGRRLRWHLGTVREWIRAHRTTALENPTRRVGAPRK